MSEFDIRLKKLDKELMGMMDNLDKATSNLGIPKKLLHELMEKSDKDPDFDPEKALKDLRAKYPDKTT